MHEYGIMEAIVRDAFAEANRHGGVPILSLQVELGELSGMSAESLRTAFDAITKGTALEGAPLELRVVPGRVRCDACNLVGNARDLGLEVGHENPLLICPKCGFFLTAMEGRGVILKGVTLRILHEDRSAGGHPSASPTPASIHGSP